jgi:putative membrane protein
MNVLNLPTDPSHRVAYLLFLLTLIASCIAPPYPEFLLMQHAPTVLVALILPHIANRYPVSRLSFASITLFLCLHTVGARYLYSYTPYDDWTRALFGKSVSEALGFTRNHYDRLVHFCYGLLLAVPIQEFERRHLGLSAKLASILAVECILATSAAYELAEWLVAVTFTPRWADQFLGQQGDIFDAQKDMALATVGAIISVGIVSALTRRRAAN